MYGFTTTLSGLSFDEALDRTPAALKAEGLGVLSDIDVQRAMKEEPGVGFGDPQTMVGLVGKDSVRPVADEAQSRPPRACAALGGTAPQA